MFGWETDIYDHSLFELLRFSFTLVFLPASSTSFSLAYPALFSYGISSRITCFRKPGSGSSSSSLFTLPWIMSSHPKLVNAIFMLVTYKLLSSNSHIQFPPWLLHLDVSLTSQSLDLNPHGTPTPSPLSCYVTLLYSHLRKSELEDYPWHHLCLIPYSQPTSNAYQFHLRSILQLHFLLSVIWGHLIPDY